MPGYLLNTAKPPSAWRQAPAETTAPPVAGLGPQERSKPASAKEVVQDYLEVFHDIGGRQALAARAKLNPDRYYMDLKTLLVAMEAPKAAIAIQVNYESMSTAEIQALSSAELKRLIADGKAPDTKDITPGT